jgi:hypothetical protein
MCTFKAHSHPMVNTDRNPIVLKKEISILDELRHRKTKIHSKLGNILK